MIEYRLTLRNEDTPTIHEYALFMNDLGMIQLIPTRTWRRYGRPKEVKVLLGAT